MKMSTDELVPSRATLAPRSVSLSTGVRVEYVEQGDTTGVPVVFLHGVTDSWRSFELLFRHLPPGVHAFAWSQRGHGESSKPAAGYLFADFAADAAAFMDAMGLDRAVMVGHSMGASVAQRCAVLHPDRVSGLVLMGAFAGLYQNPGIGEFVQTQVTLLADPISPDFARSWQLSTTALPLDSEFLDMVVAETLKVPAHVWHQTFDGFLRTPDCVSELSHVRVPALMIWGDRDTYAGRADQDTLIGALAGSRLRVYEGVGHALHWEEPERAAASVLEFLGDLGYTLR